MSNIKFEVCYSEWQDENGIELEQPKEYEKEFIVSEQWAKKWIEENYNESLKDFYDEYTSDQSLPMYLDAKHDNAIIKEQNINM